jgi:predicted dehydrogenase
MKQRIESDKKKIRYGIIGGGFRAKFFLKAALEIPELFEVTGLVTNFPESTAEQRARLGVTLYRNAEELLEHEKPDFLVVTTKRPVDTPPREPMDRLAGLGFPILMETPAAWSFEALHHIYELCRGKKVQVAEQVHAQPENAARIAVAHSGILGAVSQAELSFQHSYHCINVLRRFLKLGFENAEITGKVFHFPVVQGYTRSGVANTEQIVNEKRIFSLLDFNGKLGVYNYEDNQVRAYVRAEHIAVRGERGEINGQTVRWLHTHEEYRQYTYERIYSGAGTSLEGFFFRGLMGGGRWIYSNPYPHRSLCDDDIAVMTVLEKMARYVREGRAFSSIANACQDQYLFLMIEKSAKEGRPLLTETQPWADERDILA